MSHGFEVSGTLSELTNCQAFSKEESSMIPKGETIQDRIDRIQINKLPPLFTEDTITRGIKYLKHQMETNGGLDHCARCSKRHTRLAWRPITRPTAFDNWLLIGFAFCPTAWEPILLAIAEDIRRQIYLPPDSGSVIVVPDEFEAAIELTTETHKAMTPVLVYGLPVVSDPDYQRPVDVTDNARRTVDHGPAGVLDSDE